MADLKILVVDDEEIPRKTLTTYLQPYGTCDIAEDGVQSVEKTRAQLVAAQKSYDLICMDIKMPNMDGQQALKQIRKLEEKHGCTGEKSSRVIMTTLKDDMTSVMQAFKQQCEVYLIKPVRKEDLLKHLRKMKLIDAKE